jgi:hypothetical protein
MSTTLIPTQDQTQLMLESPMTEAELRQLAQLEATGSQSTLAETTCKIQRASCLLQVYNDKLFRGKGGGRTWGQYLQSIDLARLGYVNGLETDTAVCHMNFAMLCEAIDDWNEANPDRPALPYPGAPSYMQGWTLLFDRARTAAGVQGTYAPITGAAAALKAWKTAVIKNNGQPLTRNNARAIGRAARDAGEGRNTLGHSGNLATLKQSAPASGRSENDAEYSQPAANPEVVAQAAADRAARKEQQEAIRAEERELREAGIDPRQISVMEGESEFDAVRECETYSTQLNKVHFELQTLEVWLRGRLNQYGSDGMDFLRSLDAGLYTINDDLKALYGFRERVDELIELLEDDIAPGQLTSTVDVEPTH